MNNEHLKRFDLQFPGIWIDNEDRDLAFNIQNILSLIQTLFIEAVASYGLFQQITPEKIRKSFEEESRYERCLNGLYAKSFVFALNGIEKLLQSLVDENMYPPIEVSKLYEEYKKVFGHLKHIRDSAIHVEDRGRGFTRKQKPIAAQILVIGSFRDNFFTFSGENGQLYEVEISCATLDTAKEIIQKVIDSFKWTGIGIERF